MAFFKNSLIECQQCRRKILVKPADVERGTITCSHVGCGAINSLATSWYYSPTILDGLSEVGMLSGNVDSSVALPLQLGINTLGVGNEASVILPRILHGNQCFISRLHCTLTITFDKWAGQLRYQLQDGVITTDTNLVKISKNGTLLNDLRLKPGEVIDIPDGGLITLGGLDTFRLSHHLFSPERLITYKTQSDFDPDSTE